MNPPHPSPASHPRHPRHPPVRPAAARGLTLPELLLAIAGTAIIGAAVATMLTGVAYGSSTSHDLRTLVTRHKVLGARLVAAVRESRQVLAADADTLVLWVSDADGDDKPSLLELRRVEFDTVGQTLSSYRAPTGTTDVVYEPTDDFMAITDALLGGVSLPQTLWGQAVAGLAIELDEPVTTDAQLVTLTLTLSAGGLTDRSVHVARLRNTP